MGLGHSHSGHDHGHIHTQPSGNKDAGAHQTALLRALTVTLLFAFVEVIGGFYANSLALLSDAVHMLTDAGALTLSLVVIWVARKAAPRGYTYGFQRVEILGALLNALLVWLVSGFLIFESIERFQNPAIVKGGVLFSVASIGLLVNLASLYFLHRSSKENLNIRSAYLHVLTDALGSIGAMIAGGVIALTGWVLVDPIVTVLLSLMMLWSSWRLIREAFEILMERSPQHLQVEEIQNELEKLEGVSGLHDLHIWTLSSGSVALSVHLIGADSERILHAAAHLLDEKFDITHTTIQVESENSGVTDHCKRCD